MVAREGGDAIAEIMTMEAPRAIGRPRDEQATEAIERAALRQLEETGYGRLSMESVASEAGVARATVYRRYKDKADLVTSAIARNVTTQITDADMRSPRTALAKHLVEFDDRFGHSCVEVLGGLLANREEPGALELHRQRVIAPRRAYLRRLLERARDLGQLSPDADLDLALDMLVGVVIARAVSGVKNPRGWAQRALDVVWNAMGGAIR